MAIFQKAKSGIGWIALMAALVGVPAYDSAAPQTCTYAYDRSLDGLWLVKERICRGPIGITVGRKTVARKPLFEEF